MIQALAACTTLVAAVVHFCKRLAQSTLVEWLGDLLIYDKRFVCCIDPATWHGHILGM